MAAGAALRRTFAGPFGLRSLAVRVIAFSTIWAVAALIAITTVIATLYRENSERGFESLLSAHLFNLIGSVGVTPEGVLTGSPDLGDLRFSEPRSGWYWSVEPVSGGIIGERRSLSMTGAIASPPVEDVPFDIGFQRSYQTRGLSGEQLEVLENEFALDNQNRAARFRVMGNRTQLEAEIDGFERRLIGYLALFGGGMVAINAGAILLGLRPLGRVREALANMREGNAQRLTGRFPAEIAPLASETNALIENNRRLVERTRAQVGNLAHSLKTPLAVLLNEGRSLGGEKGEIIVSQAGAMQGQVEHYLQRARIAAQRDILIYRTPVMPALQRLVRVIEKLNPEAAITLIEPPAEILFAGEEGDLEEIAGNILDNAAKWAKSRIQLSAAPVGAGEGKPGRFDLVIEDDGPGVPEAKTRDVLKRGRRLDETKPGSGLGLSIVAELVREYGGELALGRSELGGLKVSVRLGAVE